ncbi:unnamed protein product, partial [marine sediment metagenome]
RPEFALSFKWKCFNKPEFRKVCDKSPNKK